MNQVLKLISKTKSTLHPSATPCRHLRTTASAVMDSRDMKFQLNEVLQVETEVFQKVDKFQDHSKLFVNSALDMAETLARQKFLPSNRQNDLNEPEWNPDTNSIDMIPEIADSLYEFNQAGLSKAHADFDYDGMQLPSCVTNCLMFPFYAGNVGTMTYPFLTIAASNMLKAAGSEQQIEKYYQKMIDGDYTGTMNLSETQAGSSLADITTKATPNPDGTYSIKGTKMWISGGEHELSENIIHMVLAKVSDPKDPQRTASGVKGISLFIVPKFRQAEDGTASQHNDIALSGLNHKMGWRGTTNCVLNFGENGDCVGELLGEEGKGLHIMFGMMNEARIGVGVIATALGYSGYYNSLRYAQERKQGRPVDNKDQSTEPVPIIQHADVKRMLLAQKAYVEGSLALCLYSSFLVDTTHQDSDSAKSLLLDVLTPITKSWPSEWCLEANKWAIQIHGGYGYTKDFSVEQTYRDNRLNMIHEGTNGIQSIDLLGRKMTLAQGRGLDVLVDAMLETVRSARTVVSDEGHLRQHCESLQQATTRLRDTTIVLRAAGDASTMLCNSHEYLNMAGHTVIAWMWLQQELAAQRALSNPNRKLSQDDKAFYQGKLFAARYFYTQELPKTIHQAHLLQSLDTTNMEMKPEFF